MLSGVSRPESTKCLLKLTASFDFESSASSASCEFMSICSLPGSEPSLLLSLCWLNSSVAALSSTMHRLITVISATGLNCFRILSGLLEVIGVDVDRPVVGFRAAVGGDTDEVATDRLSCRCRFVVDKSISSELFDRFIFITVEVILCVCCCCSSTLGDCGFELGGEMITFLLMSIRTAAVSNCCCSCDRLRICRMPAFPFGFW